MSEIVSFLEKIKDIQRRVNSFSKLEPQDIMIQYEKIYLEFEKIQTDLTNNFTDKGNFEQKDILQLMTFNQVKLDSQIKLNYALIKKLIKDIDEIKKKK